MAITRDNSVKTFVSLCLLNLFLFLQFLVASEQLSRRVDSSGETGLRCAVTHWSINAQAEIVSTDVVIPAPRFLLIGERLSTSCFVVRDYLITPGRGPPSFHS